jgi:outer membrane biosynthesis protein TonB
MHQLALKARRGNLPLSVLVCFAVVVVVPMIAQTPPQDAKKNASPSRDLGAIEILSDTKGVDFGPYIERLHDVVQARWEPLIPPVALPPEMKSGTAVIGFAILQDGTIKAMRMVRSSGDFRMDRAAWFSISTDPLPKLPDTFKGEYILLQCAFRYNPPKNQADKN